MINPLDELSDIYLGQISEADNSPEAIKARVMQHVRAIRYRARKEGDQLNKAYNDYMAGQAGISATEKSMVKERLGLTGGSEHQEGMAYGMYKGSGKPAGVMKDYLDKKAKKLEKEKEKQKPEYKNNPAFGDPSHHSNRKTRTEAKQEGGYISNAAKAEVRNERRFGKKGSATPTGTFGQGTSEKAKLAVKRGEEHKARRGVKTKPTVTIDKPDRLVSLRVSKEGYYDWRQELSEYSGSMPVKVSDAEKRITEKKVKNKVTVNPAQGQAESFAKELGGQLLEACEVFQMFELDNGQIQLLEVKDKKGKGSGTKDACYHKVKSRYSVWPSAYASGALVKCRRVGADNWGNSTKKEDVQWKDIQYKAKSGESTFLSDLDGNISFEIVDVIVPAVKEAKVDKGRSDYGKASIRNYRRMGPGHDEPGMFDPEGKRGKTIDKRREEHKARRGVKGAKVPAYKVEEVEVAEDYETKKKEEIMGALKKRDLKQKVKEKIAADIIKRKGDVSKSDDRYAYESVEQIDELSNTTTANYLYHARVDKGYVHGGKMGKYQKARDKGIKRAEKKLGKKVSDRLRYVADYDTRTMRDDPNTSEYPRKFKVKEEVVSEGPLGAIAGGVLGGAVGGPAGAIAGAALGSKVDVLGGGKKKTKATKPTPAPKPAPKPNVDAEKAKKAKRARLVKIMDKERLNKEGYSNWRDTLDEKCWAGYEKKGMKTMFGKRYPNCVKKKTNSEEVEFQEKLDLKKADMGDVVKDFYKSDAPQFKGRSKEKRREMAIAAKLTAERGKLPEEVVTEVSKKTLGSYVKKAATEIGTSAMKGDYKKMQKRHKGVLDASDKLTKEEVGLSTSVKATKAKEEAMLRKKEQEAVAKKKMKEEVVTELNRFEKEKGVDTKTGKPVTKGGTAKSDKAFQFVMKKFGKQRVGANQPKKVRGAKNPNETSPTKQKLARMKAAKASSRAFETRAKKAGYKTAQDYANVVARYGSEDNMKKGRGLGT